MEQDPCKELHSDDTIELTQCDIEHQGESAMYEKDGWLITIISDKEDLWKIETPDGALITAIGNILSHKGYNDELFHISNGNELLLEWMGTIVKKHGLTKRAPLMFYIKGTTRLISNGSGLWRLCLPDGTYTAGSGDLFRDGAFDEVREKNISQYSEKFIDVLKRRFAALYKNSYPNWSFHVIPEEQVWTLKFRRYENYMGYGDPFCDAVFANVFDIWDDGKLSAWLKARLAEHNITYGDCRLWHKVNGKYRSIIGELSGGKVIHFKKTANGGLTSL
ncbi:MAG: hypothetical protein ACLQQ4_01730 [Bacteroidia bacterium]